MAIHTYRARNLSDALRLVRAELGPEASVLHTREVGSAWSWWLGGTQIEVTASAEVCVPSRLPSFAHQGVSPAELLDFRRRFRDALALQASDEASLVEQLSRAGSQNVAVSTMSRRWAQVDLPTCGPLQVAAGRRTVAALVGPTGVGKTTTIAKLAAHYRLRERASVGLVTVDTYRIAAVEQLRTYAEIMDLPLEVVATKQEMRAAIDRLAEKDLVLIDTAGCSPRDAVRLQELRGLLAESPADEVYVVLSAPAGAQSVDAAAGAFATVGASAVVLTKLDEADSLAWLPGLLRRHRLPLAYTTNGQDVPDDIRPAGPSDLAEFITA
jgi:flagellar biosynthesis protein FlhF